MSPGTEQLSEFADNRVEDERRKSLEAHINSCEMCARDVVEISRMRGLAAMRESITVSPEMSKRGAPLLGRWGIALAGVSAAALVAVVALSISQFSSVAKHPAYVAVAPHKQPVRVAVAPPQASAPVESSARAKSPATAVGPGYTCLLTDGGYRVVRKGDRVILADAAGRSVRSALEARIAASIDEKLRTGRVKLDKPIELAMNTIHTRGSEYSPPPTAPTTLAPVGKVVLATTPTFKWTSVDMAQAYHLSVTDKQGNVVADEIVPGNSCVLTRPLRRGEIYRWQVGVRFGETDGWATSQAAGFQVLSSQDYSSIRNLRSHLPHSHLALGAAYESFGLYDEAASEYRALRRSNRHSALAHKLLIGASESMHR